MLLISGINAYSQVIGTQTFDTDVLVHGTTPTTTQYFAPSYNTPITWTASGGNPGGYIGYSASWNNYWGNFVRMPQVNCSAYDSVKLCFDMSHSYFASQPNDWIRFYIWDQGSSSYKNPVTHVKINGVESIVNFGANGFGFKFNVARTWARVEVYFSLATITNKTNILFYVEPSCAYNNSNVYFVKFDNFELDGLSGSTGTPPDIIYQSPDVHVNTGTNVTLKARATGTAPIIYKWKKSSGTAILSTDTLLNFLPAHVNHTGQYYCVATNSYGKDSTTLINLIVDTVTVGLNDYNSASGNFEIYPNPASDCFYISGYGMISYEIFDIYGKKVGESICNPASVLTKVEISDYRNGIYFLRLKKGNDFISKKILIQ